MQCSKRFCLRNRFPTDLNDGIIFISYDAGATFDAAVYSNVLYPGVFQWQKPMTYGSKNPDYYKGKVIILCNEGVQSHAEFTIMLLQTAPNAVTIGSQTSGADGNVSTIPFVGGGKCSMTGIGIFYPDGKPTQRVGVKVDIEVKPTIKGIREGRDEVLEKALEMAK